MRVLLCIDTVDINIVSHTVAYGYESAHMCKSVSRRICIVHQFHWRADVHEQRHSYSSDPASFLDYTESASMYSADHRFIYNNNNKQIL